MKDEGQGVVTVLGLLIVALMVTGLAIDMTRAVVVRRNLQAACDAGALAGASMVDVGVLRTSGGRQIILDPQAAQTEAQRVFALQAPSGSRGTAHASATTVAIDGGATVSASLLALAGVTSFEIPVKCEAAPRRPQSP